MLSFIHINEDQRLAVGLALTFVTEALPIFEARHPSDFRPREALTAAIQWLQIQAEIRQNPRSKFRKQQVKQVQKTCETLGLTIFRTCDNRTVFPDKFDRSFLNAVYRIMETVEYSNTSCAVFSVMYITLGFVLNNHEHKEHIHNNLLELLPLILEYKIENQQKFNNPEEVFELLSDQDKDKFLFNLDVLV